MIRERQIVTNCMFGEVGRSDANWVQLKAVIAL